VIPSAIAQRDRLASVGQALDAILPVPTDTYITGDIPLLLTRLSQVPAVRARAIDGPRDAR